MLKIGDKEIDKLKIIKYTIEEEKEILRKIKSGDERLKNDFVKNYMFFVLGIADKFKKYNKNLNEKTHIYEEDIVQEGFIGLLKAIENFDLSKNIRFITYSKFWIYQSIMEFLATKTTIIALKRHVFKDYLNIKKNDFMCEFDISLIKDKLKISENRINDVRNIRKICEKNIMQIDNVEHYKFCHMNDEVFFGDLNIDVYEFVDEAITNLTFRQQNIINLYYIEKLTIDKISKKLNMNKRYIYKEKKKAFDELQKMAIQLRNEFITNI